MIDKINEVIIGVEQKHQAIKIDGICTTLTSSMGTGGGYVPMVTEVIDKIDEVSTIPRTEQNRTEQNRTEQNRTEQNEVLVRQATKEGWISCVIGGVANLDFPTSETRRGRVIENGTICPTLTTESIPSVLDDWIWEVDGIKYRIRIRKLTPKECWRLMGFDDEDFDKAEKVNSNTQLYKEAGNSIVVNVLEEIFKQLIE